MSMFFFIRKSLGRVVSPSGETVSVEFVSARRADMQIPGGAKIFAIAEGYDGLLECPEWIWENRLPRFVALGAEGAVTASLEKEAEIERCESAQPLGHMPQWVFAFGPSASAEADEAFNLWANRAVFVIAFRESEALSLLWQAGYRPAEGEFANRAMARLAENPPADAEVKVFTTVVPAADIPGLY